MVLELLLRVLRRFDSWIRYVSTQSPMPLLGNADLLFREAVRLRGNLHQSSETGERAMFCTATFEHFPGRRELVVEKREADIALESFGPKDIDRISRAETGSHNILYKDNTLMMQSYSLYALLLSVSLG